MTKKRRTPKVKAKIALLDLYNKHAFLSQRKELAKVVKTINDENLEFLVANFILAKQELELHLEKIKAEVAPFLPDDSDF